MTLGNIAILILTALIFRHCWKTTRQFHAISVKSLNPVEAIVKGLFTSLYGALSLIFGLVSILLFKDIFL